MNKNLILTALLVAVSCQSVSAIVMPTFEVPVVISNAFTNVTSFVGNHKIAAATVVGISALAVAGYKYLTREKTWVEGNCVKSEKRNIFGTMVSKGFTCFKSPEDAVAAKKAMSLKTLKTAAEIQRTNPNLVLRAMTPAEKEQFDRDVQAFRQEQHRVFNGIFCRTTR